MKVSSHGFTLRSVDEEHAGIMEWNNSAVYASCKERRRSAGESDDRRVEDAVGLGGLKVQGVESKRIQASSILVKFLPALADGAQPGLIPGIHLPTTL
ncbi:MAG: hypothetical protein FRX49_05887 [Trebouxia sp. A1-2]|nr:MAG: hypothetical protein FRX49_05887 [Trebouxia sp. A1-2]